MTCNHDTKICKKCGKEKPLSEFFRTSRWFFGSCKSCTLEYRRANQDSLNRSRRRWEEKNKEKSDGAKRDWYGRNKKRVHESVKIWRKNNKEKAREQCRRRAVKRKGALGSHALSDWQSVERKQRGYCFYCWEPAILTRDHVHPLEHGGTDNISNIVGACRRCNSKKGTRTIIEFARLVLANPDGEPRGLVTFARQVSATNQLFFCDTK